jgi:DNA primase
MDLVADIKARLNIEDVVSSYVQLRRMGRSLKGLCPFHQEKTPSFHVSLEKQIAYCFGCHRGGDVFQFVQEVENIDFQQSLKLLADRAGLDYEQYRAHAGFAGGTKVPSKSEKEPFLDAHEKATRFFSDQLWNTQDGLKVVEYLTKRGLKEATIRDFRLGFAPDGGDDLYKFLSHEKISKDVLLQSGLITLRDTEGERVYDRFRGRLMFPIFNAAGQIVAFGGRALKKGMEPKYLNSPETALYHKSDVLYGFDRAKKMMREKGALLVEGYMDLIACHQAGFTNAVAASGTALTSQHVRMLKRFTDTFYFCFDNDHAGWQASRRAYGEVLAHDGFVRMIQFPDAKDPDEILRDHPEVFAAAYEQARPFLEILYERLFTEHPGNSAESVSHIMGEVTPLLKMIKSRVSLDIAVRDLAKKLGVREASVYDELNRLPKDRFSPRDKVDSEDNNNPSSRFFRQISPEETILAILFRHPEKILFVGQHLMLDSISEPYRPLLRILFEQEVYDFDAFTAQLSEEERKRVDFLSFYGETVYSQLRPDDLQKDLKASLDKIEYNRKNEQLEALKKQIRALEEQGKKDESRALLSQLEKIVRS